MSWNAFSQSLFIKERGRYSFSLSDITKLFQAEAPYLFFKGELNSDEASYKLVKQTNEFQMKDWFLKDWYSLQDQFDLDLDAFNRFYEGQDFSEAKRKQFSHFKFNKASLTFKKEIPAMKEWGGLTHPPLKVLYCSYFFFVGFKGFKQATCVNSDSLCLDVSKRIIIFHCHL
jgi:hypothetical protein